MFARYNKQYLWSLGIMSGTSLDAIDLAMLKTDGEIVVEHGLSHNVPIPADLQNDLRKLMQGEGDFLSIERRYSKLVASAVLEFIADEKVQRPDVIGFHGQTIVHRPYEGITWQIGNASLLAHLTGVGVVSDFRKMDMAAGGQGAPLVPIYHQSLCEPLPKPIAIVNIGGVTNVTYVDENELIAFDTGTGNALINDWVLRHTGEQFDEGGRYASVGKVHMDIVNAALKRPYFNAPPPKSLDRNSYGLQMVEGLSLHDGAATLMQFSVSAIALAQRYFPKQVKQWVICGGGVHNNAMMQALRKQLSGEIIPADVVGWRVDAVEAEAFAFLAVRSLRGLHLSVPSTTGVNQPVTGGVFCQP